QKLFKYGDVIKLGLACLFPSLYTCKSPSLLIPFFYFKYCIQFKEDHGGRKEHGGILFERKQGLEKDLANGNEDLVKIFCLM
ncbi:hypothetical protein KK470_29365, partial [Klebsiella pneumoniae]|uniref:hypothetical protein n=1 Tax=Klebsiella pneumoniae TaxID=573 RepID=UPI001BDF8404